MQELAPEGWKGSPLRGVFHPTVEQVYAETVRIHTNIRKLLPAGARIQESAPPSFDEICRQHREEPVRPREECADLIGLWLWDIFSDNHEVLAILRNTTKPVIYSAPGRRHAAALLEMAAAVSGGEDSLRRRPSMVLFTQPVSPLQIGPYSEGMIEAAALGVPVLASPGPMMGATSPATLAGTLVQVNAEALFGVVLRLAHLRAGRRRGGEAA